MGRAMIAVSRGFWQRILLQIPSQMPQIICHHRFPIYIQPIHQGDILTLLKQYFFDASSDLEKGCTDPITLVLLLGQFSNGHDLFAFLNRDQPDALRRPSLNGDVGHFQADDLSRT